MLGAMLVFAAVVLIVGCYMAIVHSFLKSAEEPGDFAPAPSRREARRGAPDRRPIHAQLAH